MVDNEKLIGYNIMDFLLAVAIILQLNSIYDKSILPMTYTLTGKA